MRVLIEMRDLRVGNGIAACIMNYYEYTVQDGISIDFLLSRDIESPYRDMVIRGGSHIFVLPYNTSKPRMQNDMFIKKLVSRGYDVLHVNMSGYYAMSALKAAAKAGVLVRIYHTHIPKEFASLKALVRNKLYVEPSITYANRLVACSRSAGKSLFKEKKFTVIHNAMHTVKYKFDLKQRTILRNDLGIANRFVIGVVARMEDQKNPFFLLDIFTKFYEKCPDSVLIWAGEGALWGKIQKYVQEKGIAHRVKLLGTRKDVNYLYSAMDMFLLPSQYEGLGLVFVEAQISGLQCFGSDCVPEDVEITENMKRLPLSMSSECWAEEMRKNSELEIDRTVAGMQVAESKFEIDNQRDALRSLYQ